MELSLEAGIGIIAGMDASSREPAAVSTARRMVRHAARSIPARARAGVLRPDGRRHLRLSAIQIGLPSCPFLAQSRIASRWTVDREPPAQVLADPHWLPFPENSLDLVVLPHALEFTTEPHQLLREVYRAVRPEGQIVLAGFNPFSLFGARRYFGRGETPPWNGSFIALYRLKDWLALLGFEVTGGGLDCYVPPFAQEKWLRRCGFFEQPAIAGGPSPAASTSCARPRGCSACASSRRRGSGATNGLATAPRQARQGIERVESDPRAARGPPSDAASSRSTPTARARETPGPAAGARCSSSATARRSSSAASPPPPTTGWS